MAALILLKSCSLELIFLDSRLRPAFLNRSKNFFEKFSLGYVRKSTRASGLTRKANAAKAAAKKQP